MPTPEGPLDDSEGYEDEPEDTDEADFLEDFPDDAEASFC
jgi:hypothetical protein